MSDFKNRMYDIAYQIDVASKKILSSNNLTPLAQELAEKIRTRTRLGYGSKGQKREKLKELTDQTIQKRKAMKKAKTLFKKTTPQKSNLTATGQMLESLTGVGENEKIRVTPTGDRTDSDLSNVQVAEFVTDGGRPFIQPTNTERKALAAEIRKLIVAEVERNLTKR